MDKYQILVQYYDQLLNDLEMYGKNMDRNKTDLAQNERRYQETLVKLENVQAQLNALAVAG